MTSETAMGVTRAVGGIEITGIVEFAGQFLFPEEMFPAATPDAIAPHRCWLEPAALCPESGRLNLTVQSFVLRTRHHTILVDPCVGNDKTLEIYPPWHKRRDFTWLNNLKAQGLTPEDIDVVMCTHLHIDHSGWNTSLIDGHWRPTFPKARYLFSRRELAAAEALGGPTFEENVLPILEAGLADLVEPDFVLDDEVSFEPTPGHTPGHVSVRLASGGACAVISGDVMHSPLQCAEPEWGCVFDAMPEEADRTRRRFLERACADGTLVFANHFPLPSAGLIAAHGKGFRFRYRE